MGDSDEVIERLAPLVGEAVKRCVAVGLPAVFAWVYDEPWACYARLRPVFAHFLGAEFKPLPAFWAWLSIRRRARPAGSPTGPIATTPLPRTGRRSRSPAGSRCPVQQLHVHRAKAHGSRLQHARRQAGAADARVCRACAAGESRRLPGLEPMRHALGRPDERVRRASAHGHGTRVSARRRSTHHEAVPARGTSPGPAALAGAEARSRLRHPPAARRAADPPVPAHVWLVAKSCRTRDIFADGAHARRLAVRRQSGTF